MGLNVELLERVKAHILEEPDRFVMADGLILRAAGTCITDEDAPDDDMDAPVPTRIVPACGTVACIAGWACVLSDGAPPIRNGFVPWSDIEPRAAALLGLRAEDASKLFQVAYWPEEDAYAYEEAASRAERVRIAAARIDAFIAEYREARS